MYDHHENFIRVFNMRNLQRFFHADNGDNLTAKNNNFLVLYGLNIIRSDINGAGTI
jgi:hypothetical protein